MISNKKLLITSHYTFPHRGGIETIVEKLSLSLAEQGYQVRVVASKIPGQSALNFPSRQILGVPAFDPLKRYGVHYPLFAPSLMWVLWQQVRWADLIHAQGMLYLITVFALVLARLLHRPAVLTEHAGFVSYSNPFFNFTQSIAAHTLGRLSLNLANAIIVPDTIVQQILEEKFGVPTHKIRRIPLGVDTTLFHPVKESQKRALRQELGWDDRPKVLFVGNYVARKRIPLLLETLSEQFDLVLCGEGYETLSLPSGIILYPPLEHEHLVRLYQAADLFVVPSSVETFAIVAYEAMACGLPVIMTNDLLHLTIRESGLVQFVEPTVNNLRQAIHSLLSLPEERRRIGKESADWVETRFSWKASIQQHHTLYHTLLHPNG